MSYQNFLLYSVVIPSYGGTEDKKKKNRDNGEIIRADDPKNKDLVKAIINGYKF